ncbi:PduL/EutD family phosphate acyltransferase, partial [Geobacillus thermoleovorans]|uniref:PduL/EutD family phosphate acyltransferase n=2 Tax=Geobacillus TaxID=129337 RepID=UPI00345C3B56
MLNVIPVGVSARHVHLCEEHIEILFGRGYRLNVERELSQPGQFAAKEKVSLLGPGGIINNVRVLGPARPCSQVEVSITD